MLECRSSGGKTYYLRYFDQHGRQRQLKIGGHGEITFDQARKAARRLRSEVVLGGDPAATKEDLKGVPTYAALAAQHVAHAKTYQKSWWSTEGIIRNHILPRWGRLRLDEITSQAVAQWLAEKARQGPQASHCREDPRHPRQILRARARVEHAGRSDQPCARSQAAEV